MIFFYHFTPQFGVFKAVRKGGFIYKVLWDVRVFLCNLRYIHILVFSSSFFFFFTFCIMFYYISPQLLVQFWSRRVAVYDVPLCFNNWWMLRVLHEWLVTSTLAPRLRLGETWVGNNMEVLGVPTLIFHWNVASNGHCIAPHWVRNLGKCVHIEWRSLESWGGFSS